MERLTDFLGSYVCGNELQRDTVVAVTKPGGLRPVVEHMPMVTATTGAKIFLEY
jgi:hypothetical protein